MRDVRKTKLNLSPKARLYHLRARNRFQRKLRNRAWHMEALFAKHKTTVIVRGVIADGRTVHFLIEHNGIEPLQRRAVVRELLGGGANRVRVCRAPKGSVLTVGRKER